MTYQLHEEWSSPNFTDPAACVHAFGYPRVIIGYTYHHWDRKGSGATFEGTVATLTNDYRNPGSRGVSAHFVVEAGRVACLVSPVNAAWHAGNAKGNAQTIGLECNPAERDSDYQTAIEFQAWLFARYGVKPLYHHCDWTATECPGTYDLNRIYNGALALFHAGSAKAPVVKPAPKPAPKPAAVKPAAAHITPIVKHNAYVPDLHWQVARGEVLSTVAAYFKTDIGTLARYNGIKNVNVITPNEWIWPATGYGTWLVEKGDSLNSITAWCQAHWNKGITAHAICNANGINNPSALPAGRRLQIPK